MANEDEWVTLTYAAEEKDICLLIEIVQWVDENKQQERMCWFTMQPKQGVLYYIECTSLFIYVKHKEEQMQFKIFKYTIQMRKYAYIINGIAYMYTTVICLKLDEVIVS